MNELGRDRPLLPGYPFQRWVGDKWIGVAVLTFGRGRLLVGDEREVFDGW